MEAELKRILSDNNICGFTGDTVNDLVRQLKADNLCLKAENMQLKRKLENMARK